MQLPPVPVFVAFRRELFRPRGGFPRARFACAVPERGDSASMDPNKSKGKGKGGRPGYMEEHVSAQFSSLPASECIGAGRLEGWFSTPAWMVEGRGWGHIQSYCFEGDLFFHMSRSPLLRNINYQKKDPVTFEVLEFNGQCEAVKLLLPRQVMEMESGETEDQFDSAKPEPRDLVGQRIEGIVRSQWQLVKKQSWGFCASEHFKGQVFFHITESPDMAEVEFEREDLVEFEIYLGGKSGNDVRARNMVYIGSGKRVQIGPKKLSEKKLAQKEAWKRNWRKGHPPDWECKNCMFTNFGRNKICRSMVPLLLQSYRGVRSRSVRGGYPSVLPVGWMSLCILGEDTFGCSVCFGWRRVSCS
ncbi:unnamed protein product [Prorocentrum cordatum]|uniref:CSD domain-containing protein n=1 Tax=Prorocentrum cordatum TaxID=2364126 RepID=A0ABN9PAE3_9DINO|nr:unnamed protein product [Polarella glacialis]